MTPEAVFALVKAMGGTLRRVLIVGYEPAHTAEGIGLSAPVARAVDDVLKLILDLIRREGDAGIEGAQARQAALKRASVPPGRGGGHA